MLTWQNVFDDVKIVGHLSSDNNCCSNCAPQGNHSTVKFNKSFICNKTQSES